MGKQKNTKEWLYWFAKYESGTLDWSKYYASISISGDTKSRKNAKQGLKNKYKNYNRFGKSIIISMRGRKSTGRPKNPPSTNWDNFTRDELIDIAKRYKETTTNKKKLEKDIEVTHFSNMSKIKLAWLLNISRSGLYYKKTIYNKRDPIVEKIVSDEFIKNKGIFGRDRIAAITVLNYRRVGRYLRALNLICKIRKAKRRAEIKNINIKFCELVKRDYSKKNVIATDVSYIPTINGFAYLSIAIDHYTKKILSWNFGKQNTNELVMEHFKNLDLEGKIVHSDHGYQYSSTDYTNLSKAKKFKISMSRVGNSLDNREAEYFFSNIKSERLNLIKSWKMPFHDIKKEIDHYIQWYNNARPQSKLEWRTPEYAHRMSI